MVAIIRQESVQSLGLSLTPEQTCSERAHPANTQTEPQTTKLSSRNLVIGFICLTICLAAFVGQTLVVQQIESGLNFHKPYFILWSAHSWYILVLPLHLLFELCRPNGSSLRQLSNELFLAAAHLMYPHKVNEYEFEVVTSYNEDPCTPDAIDDLDPCSISAFQSLPSTIDDPKVLPLSPTDRRNILIYLLKLGVWVSMLLNSACYTWYIAVAFTSPARITSIYNTSCFFAYIFSVFMLNEPVVLAKVVAVALSVIGVGIISMYEDDNDGNPSAIVHSQPTTAHVPPAPVQHQSSLFGDMLSLICAIGMAFYQVFYKKYVVPKTYQSLFYINYMTSMVGIGTLTACGLPLIVLHLTGYETFEIPPWDTMRLVLFNGVMGMSYHGSFMIMIALTSPVFAAVGIMLTIPLMAVIQALLTSKAIGLGTLAGDAAILVGFAILTQASLKEATTTVTHYH